jgi:glucosamine--fructose-6-phosphate aminotransferase (isomerizing)
MNINEEKYSKFALVKEMLETAEVVRKLDTSVITDLAAQLGQSILLTGEGSSRIFPAKNAIANALDKGYAQKIFTEGATQAMDYKLNDHSVFVASNSGKTKEGVRLIRHLKETSSVKSLLGVVAHAGTPIIAEANGGYVLSCGNEDAVAATKSVAEQALVYELALRKLNGIALPDLQALGDGIEKVLTTEIPENVIAPLIDSPILYWAGRNNGVAEELRLKTNEITRKKSDFLEGTYAAHGIEEVMSDAEAIIAVNPWEAEEAKYREVLVDGVGIGLVAISTRQTSFPTYQIPDIGDMTAYLELAAGWNLLVEVGVQTGIDLDKPVRARKVGNEFIA